MGVVDPPNEDVRGSAPVYTTKDVLLRLDSKVSEIDVKLDGLSMSLAILVDQRLNSRVVELESWRHSHEGRMIGLATGASALVTAVMLVIAIVTGIVGR